MILTIVIISILLVASIGINVYFAILLNKFIDKIESDKKFIDDLEKSINLTYKQLKAVDDRQLFEKDDDVGFVFTSIVKLIEKLKSQV